MWLFFPLFDNWLRLFLSFLISFVIVVVILDGKDTDCVACVLIFEETFCRSVVFFVGEFAMMMYSYVFSIELQSLEFISRF